jgi:hypothetical protein
MTSQLYWQFNFHGAINRQRNKQNPKGTRKEELPLQQTQALSKKGGDHHVFRRKARKPLIQDIEGQMAMGVEMVTIWTTMSVQRNMMNTRMMTMYHQARKK